MKEFSLDKISAKYGIDVSNVKAYIDDRNIAHIEGTVSNWEEVLKLGRKVLKATKCKNVVNDCFPKDNVQKIQKDQIKIKKAKEIGVIDNCDIAIIGGGVIGCSIARELAKYNKKIILIEKEKDVADGATKANNGMIHPGNGAVPGTLKAKLNVQGNAMYTQFSKELGFKFNRTGSMVCYTKGCNKLLFFAAYLAGKLNKVPGTRIVTGKQAMKIDPNLANKPILGVWTPTTGYVDGFEVAIAAAENAADNGVKFLLDHEVVDIVVNNSKIDGVVTNKGIINAKIIINAAGIYADYIAEFAGDRFYTIHPRKGVIAILDKNVKGSDKALVEIGKVTKTFNHSKGGGGERTVAGNPLFGPSAREVQDREDLSVNVEDLDYAYEVGHIVYPDGTRDKVITYFAGLRAADYTEDFIIEESEIVDGFIHCSAIQSPGLASAPAIAKYVEDIVVNYYKSKGENLCKNNNYNPIRKPRRLFNELSNEEKEEMIKKDPRYGRVICRCETITEGDIVDALHASIPCVTIEGIKRRVRATAGRCQGGFCGPKIVEIMSRELGCSMLDISQKGHDHVLIAKTRGGKNE